LDNSELKIKKCISEGDYTCPIDATVKVICGKYKGIILYHLIEKTLRFNEVQKILKSATPKMVTQQLRELERDGIVHRRVYPVVPPKTEYSLTELGRSVVPVILHMREWGISYLER